jgi:hypothetical protein
MGTTTASVPRSSTTIEEYVVDDRAEFVEAPGTRNRSARGAITGVLLGAGLWGAILVLTGVIKI